ncbi:S-methyl-5'-thioadenosine phosphorylase isoform X1 [Ixodes scapularis]|uniref:S-methyl-5'-thioadenosine phosphorylase isoform X1 n=1 Tax=Ixodes scapularis TaxID=6945 RepID=UPI001AD7BEB2|nr:S-methyl-5'-thioadenosine phosphorylase isoform X1 [Ixodes scapularis]
MSEKVKVGIIGGSGLDDPDILEHRKEHKVTTPFGEPSDVLVSGQIGHVDCVLLARHGRNHGIMPTNVNYRANIWALREMGCTHVLATTACGSLHEDFAPGHVVFPDQFIDRTTKRESTFHDGKPGSPKGVCHLSMASPFHPELRKLLIQVARELHLVHHEKGTVVTIEGPRFSSAAESIMFRSWGCHVINMTTVPEVVLAKEAGLLYAAIALPTDYDSWRTDLAHVGSASTSAVVSAHCRLRALFQVDVKQVLETMKENSERALRILRAAIPRIAAEDWTAAIHAAQETAKESVME